MKLESRVPLSLVLRAPTPVARRPATRRALSPLAMIAVGAGAVASSLVLPVGLVAMSLVTGLVALVVAQSSAGSLRAAIAAERVANAKRVRRVEREERLPVASWGRQTLAELTQLVDEIEAQDPDAAHRFDLEALLDRHVTLTLAHERALGAVRLADRAQLEHICDGYRADPATNPRRLEMCERRLQSQAQAQARAQVLADELAILSDLLHLIAQRVACPDEPPADDVIERQLAELDDDDAARRQLAELP